MTCSRPVSRNDGLQVELGGYKYNTTIQTRAKPHTASAIRLMELFSVLF